jgi:hypothetical protein
MGEEKLKQYASFQPPNFVVLPLPQDLAVDKSCDENGAGDRLGNYLYNPWFNSERCNVGVSGSTSQACSWPATSKMKRPITRLFPFDST